MIHIFSILPRPGIGDRIIWLGEFRHIDTAFLVIADMINDRPKKEYAICDDREG